MNIFKTKIILSSFFICSLSLAQVGCGAKIAVPRRDVASSSAPTSSDSSILPSGTPTTLPSGVPGTAALSVSPALNSYGSVTVGSPSTSQSFTISNSGTASATGCSAATLSGPNAGDFAIQSDSCGSSDLAAGGNCAVTVLAQPTSTGSRTATLNRSCSNGGSALNTTVGLSVTGTVVATPSLSWSPLTNGYGSANVGNTTSAQTFTLTNSGTASATGCSAPSLAGTNAGDFVIQTDNCGTSNLAASGSCTVLVQARPTAAGSRTATLTRSCTTGGSPSTTANGLSVTGVTVPSLAWSPLTNSYGSVNIGVTTSAQTFTLTNSGTGSATGCSAPSLGGTNASDFIIQTDNCGTSSLAASGTCTVLVQAQPTAAGSRTATLSRVCTTGGTISTTTNGLSVTGVAVPSLAWSPLTNNYSSVNIGSTSTAQTFTLTNSGTASATGCSAPSLGGTNAGDFVIQTDNCGTSNLASSGTCTVLVQAQPTAAGSRTATLSRVCTTGGTISTTANGLSVTGVAVPNLAWSPLTNNYGSVNQGSTSTAQTFTLTNSGSGSATGCSAPSLAGTNSGDFVIQTDNCGTANLAASGSCTVLVQARPTAAGSRTATLTRSCTTGGTPSTTANGLSMTGVAVPILAWSPLTNSYGSVNIGSTSTAQTFTLTNSGTASATGCSAPSLGGANAGDFVIQTDNCGTSSLATSGTCTVLVQAQPTAAGSRTATLSRVCTTGGTVSTTANGLSVTGVAVPILAWSPLTNSYGSVNQGSTSSAQTFTLANSGTASATGCSAPSLAGTNAGDFVIQTDNCGTSNLAASGTCTVLVQAQPTAVGARSATLSRVCTTGGTISTTANGLTVTGLRVLTHQGWTLAQALGGRTPVPQATGLLTVAASVTLNWNAMTASDSSTIASYNIYRATSSGGQNFASALATGISASTAAYKDTTVSVSTTYYYVVRPVVGTTEYSTSSADTEIKMMVPPVNMSLVHRWMANLEMCSNLMQKTPDRSNNYRCAYVGPLSSGGYYDYGHSQFWDTVEMGCNYTSKNATAALSCNSTTNGCLGIAAPAISATTYAGQIFYNRAAQVCYLASGGAWVPASSATAAQLALMASNKPGLPPLTSLNTTSGYTTCQQFTVPGVGTKKLPKFSEHIVAAAWPMNLSDTAITNLENGTNLPTTGACNANYGNGLTFDNNKLPADLETLPATSSSSSQALRTGSNATKNCVSMHGIQDLVGNVWEWTTDQMTSCSSTTHTCVNTAPGSIDSTNTDWSSATVPMNFDGTVGPGGTSGGQTSPNYTDEWNISNMNYGTTSFLAALGLPAVGSIISAYDATPLGTNPGQLNPAKLHDGHLILYTDDGNNTTRASFVGGSYQDTTGTGRFTINLYDAPGATDIWDGFRCRVAAD